MSENWIELCQSLAVKFDRRAIDVALRERLGVRLVRTAKFVNRATRMAREEVGGFGITFKQHMVDAVTFHVCVHKIVAGGPAEACGKVKVGDRLSRIAGFDIINDDPALAPALPGPSGTFLTLTFDRPFRDLPFDSSPGFSSYTVELRRSAAFYPDKLLKAETKANTTAAVAPQRSREPERSELVSAEIRLTPTPETGSKQSVDWRKERELLLQKVAKLEQSHQDLSQMVVDLEETERSVASGQSEPPLQLDMEQLRDQIKRREQLEGESQADCVRLAKEIVRMNTELRRLRGQTPASDLDTQIAAEEAALASNQRQLELLQATAPMNGW